MSALGGLNDAEIHGLVDGRIEAGRRADVLRRLANSPTDRARVEAWQEQNDLIRSAFFGIDKEPIPVTLRLVAPPTLHCVPAAEPALVEDPAPQRASGRQIVFSTLLGTLLVAGSVGGGWMLIQPADDRSQVIDVSFERPGDDAAATASPDTDVTGSIRPRSALATNTIPDLSTLGFVFTSAETLITDPSVVMFHYRDKLSDHVRVQVGPLAGRQRSKEASAQDGKTLAWQSAGRSYALTGTVRPDRLQAIRTLLQSSAN